MAVDFEFEERQILSLRAAMEREWASGAGTLAEAIQGAGRFASGKGRHGAFDDI